VFYTAKYELQQRSSPAYVIEAVERALDVLEAFIGSERLTLVEISQRVGLNKSRVFRILHTLARRGYIERSLEGAYYSLGVKLCERAAAVRLNVKQVALPYLQQLNQRFNETVNLGVLGDGEVLYIEIIESAHPFWVATTIGKRSPVHSSSLGKAMLAYLDEGSLEALIPPKLLVKRSGRTITDSRQLRKELEKVARRGYAVDDGEDVEGAACVGAPIFDATAKPLAAISVSGPTQRITSRRNEIARALTQACDEISMRFGWQKSSFEPHKLRHRPGR
jgi:DNA-binding IclR family transcriptional regulator